METGNETRLYRGLDALHRHKDALCKHLMERYQSWFGVEFEFLLRDFIKQEKLKPHLLRVQNGWHRKRKVTGKTFPTALVEKSPFAAGAILNADFDHADQDRLAELERRLNEALDYGDLSPDTKRAFKTARMECRALRKSQSQ